MNKRFPLFLLLCLSIFSLWGQPLAFPEADGYGRFTVGGRGGKVFVVTSLEDQNDDPAPGTLRYAIEQKGARTVVFAVSGVIQLQEDLRIKRDSITIAGQTSPGGICLRGATTRIDADQVIIRYLRFRLGAIEPDDDAATGARHKDIILDHCSFSWGIDETASFYINRNFTMQYCIISESLANAGHIKGPHGYGGIWGGSGASFHHNLIAHHTSRNPRIQGYRYRYKPPYPQAEELTDIRNNLIYNWGFHSMYGGENGQFNIVNNYFKPGPATTAERFFQFSGGDSDLDYGKAYVAGNYYEGKPEWLKDNSKGLDIKPWVKGAEAPDVRACLTAQPFPPSILPWFTNETDYRHTETAEQAYQRLAVQEEVGANRNAHGFFPDPVDRRLLEETRAGTVLHGNGIIDSEKEVLPSWDAYDEQFRQFSPLPDEDLNGLPDAWEKANGVSDASAYGLSSTYTNIEVYCNELGAVKKKAQVK
ncbi:MAG: pectate lyase [Phaeodactylibacter sp.]|nr:pectate lyase [Phaeodactylibacter sp.]